MAYVLIVDDEPDSSEFVERFLNREGHRTSCVANGRAALAALINGLFTSLLEAPFGDNYAARSIVGAIASVITMPYMALVGVFIYLDMRVRKERYAAPDLERDLASQPL